MPQLWTSALRTQGRSRKDCDKYEQIVHISEGGISTFERLEKEELLQLLSEGRVKIIDNNGLR